MERVAFLVEPGQERIGCLLNPESLVARRLAGVRTRRSIGGPLTGAGLRDDRVQATGGGRTEYDLDLLFDVALAGSSIRADDVRDLTAPLWNLAENDLTGAAALEGAYGSIPLVRLIWGKSWNVPGVVVSVAERLERFSPGGVPRRSWLRMRLVRVDDVPRGPRVLPIAGTDPSGPSGAVLTHELIGGGPEAAPSLAEAFATSSALVNLALERSAVATLLAGAAATVRAAAGDVLAEIGGAVEGAGSTALATLADVAREAERVTRALLLEPARTWVNGMVVTASAVAQAVARGHDALAEAAGALGAAATQRVRAALDDLASAVRPMAAAAGAVAREVRRRATALIAAGAAAVEAVAVEGREVLLPLASAASIVGSALGRAAVAAGRSALDDLDRGLAALRTGTLDPAANGIVDALDRLGGVVETLHRLGERGAARALLLGVEGIAAASRTLKTARESLALVSWVPRIEELGDEAVALRAALGALRSGGPTPADEPGEAPDEPGEAPDDVTAPAEDAATPADEVRRRARAVRASAAVLATTVAATLPRPAGPAAGPDAGADGAAPIEAGAGADATAGTETAAEATAHLAAAVAALDAAATGPAAPDDEDPAADEARLDALLRAVHAMATAAAPAADALLRSGIADAEAAARATAASESAGKVDLGERLEHVAYRHYGDPAAWRFLAAANDIDDPLRLPAGRALRIVAR